MDPFDEYMRQQEDWQNEISKRDDRIKELEEKLKLYHLPGDNCKWFLETQKRIDDIAIEEIRKT